MVIYVIRHGESVYNVSHKLTGWAQIPLTEKGVQQALQTRDLLTGISFTKVISSDLLRAVQTAQNALPGYEIQTDPRLREIGVGTLEGCNEQDYPDALRTHDLTPYGGENTAMLVDRVARFMESLQDEPEDACIAVVCHAGTVYSILCYVMQSIVPRHVSKVFNASVSAFSYLDGQWSLLKWNESGSAALPEGMAY